MSNDDKKSESGISLLSFIGSLFAAWFGVQSNANRERDFEKGKFSYFIIGGIVFTILFVLFVIGIVQVALSTAGS